MTVALPMQVVVMAVVVIKATNNRVKIARKQRGLGPRYSLGPLPKR